MIIFFMEKINISVSKEDVSKIKDEALIIGFFKGKLKLEGPVKELDGKCSGIISEFIKENTFKGDKNEAKSVYARGNVKNIILVGLGEEERYNANVMTAVVADTLKKLKASGIKNCSIVLDSFVGKLNEEDAVEKITVSSLLGLYKFTGYRTKDNGKNGSFENVRIITNSNKNFDRQVKYGIIVSEAVNSTRDVVNTPPNVATPEYVANYTKDIAKKNGLKFTVFDEKQIEKMKLDCLLAVGKGSVNKPRLVILEYNGAPGKKQIAIVGKGITFDTGGINVKQHPFIINMKDDKGGALAAINIVEACSKLKLPLNVVAVTPLAENMIDSEAYRPDDVLTAYNKITIEIKNTDAEGRLVLADGLAYAAEKKPEAIFDIASLTGAARIVLGSVGSPFMSNNPKITEKLKIASEKSLEKLWELPLWEEYNEDVKSDIADLKNLGNEGDAGTIIGGIFLQNFVNDIPWAHIDIGETVFAKADKGVIVKGATGATVRLMVELLRDWK